MLFRSRAAMATASNVAGYAFSNTGTTASHACSYLLTAKYRVPHGEACVFTLDRWFAHAAAVRPELEELSRMMGFESAQAVADRIAYLKQITGMRTTLGQIGVPDTAEALEELVNAAAASGNMKNDINNASLEDIRKVFLSCK